jgi:ubiquinone/menaquinone biosynthesis C-methylase UbiE
MAKSEQLDPDFLKNEAYGGAGDLKTRIQIQEEYNTSPFNWFHWLYQRFDLPSQSRILELGCGPGDLWQKNFDRMPPGWEIILSDFSLGMLQEVWRSEAFVGSRFKFCALDAHAIPFPDDHFDAVIASGLIDHLSVRERGLEEIRRVLKSGGKFYTTTGGRNHLKEFDEMVRLFLPEKDIGGDPERFGLENGEAILSPWFSEIRREDFHSELEFENAEPILDYIFSEGDVREEIKGELFDQFKSFLNSRFATHGSVRVTLEKGLFQAVKA